MSESSIYNRKSARLAITPRGDLYDGKTFMRALVQDVSETGMLIVTSREFAPGTILGFRLKLSDTVTIDCEIEVRHNNDGGTGVRIDYMDEVNRKAYDDFLRECYSHHLGQLDAPGRKR
jgi:hypothetical protein